jgi:hypothetical protein
VGRVGEVGILARRRRQALGFKRRLDLRVQLVASNMIDLYNVSGVQQAVCEWYLIRSGGIYAIKVRISG